MPVRDMTAPVVAVVVAYSRFIECQDRRRRIAAGLRPPGGPPTVDVTVSGGTAAVVNGLQ